MNGPARHGVLLSDNRQFQFRRSLAQVISPSTRNRSAIGRLCGRCTVPCNHLQGFKKGCPAFALDLVHRPWLMITVGGSPTWTHRGLDDARVRFPPAAGRAQTGVHPADEQAVHVLPSGPRVGPQRRRQVIPRSQLLAERLRAQAGAEIVALITTPDSTSSECRHYRSCESPLSMKEADVSQAAAATTSRPETPSLK